MTVERRSGNRIAIWGVIISIALQFAGLVFGAGKISSSLDAMSAALNKHTQEIQDLMIDGANVKGDVKSLDIRVVNHEVRITRLEDRR